jgi:hypothetical protein
MRISHHIIIGQLMEYTRKLEPIMNNLCPKCQSLASRWYNTGNSIVSNYAWLQRAFNSGSGHMHRCEHQFICNKNCNAVLNSYLQTATYTDNTIDRISIHECTCKFEQDVLRLREFYFHDRHICALLVEYNKNCVKCTTTFKDICSIDQPVATTLERCFEYHKQKDKGPIDTHDDKCIYFGLERLYKLLYGTRAELLLTNDGKYFANDPVNFIITQQSKTLYHELPYMQSIINALEVTKSIIGNSDIKSITHLEVMEAIVRNEKEYLKCIVDCIPREFAPNFSSLCELAHMRKKELMSDNLKKVKCDRCQERYSYVDALIFLTEHFELDDTENFNDTKGFRLDDMKNFGNADTFDDFNAQVKKFNEKITIADHCIADPHTYVPGQCIRDYGVLNYRNKGYFPKIDPNKSIFLS